MLGLIAEQVASLRLEQNEGLTSQVTAASYSDFEQFGSEHKEFDQTRN